MKYFTIRGKIWRETKKQIQNHSPFIVSIRICESNQARKFLIGGEGERCLKEDHGVCLWGSGWNCWDSSEFLLHQKKATQHLLLLKRNCPTVWPYFSFLSILRVSDKLPQGQGSPSHEHFPNPQDANSQKRYGGTGLACSMWVNHAFPGLLLLLSTFVNQWSNNLIKGCYHTRLQFPQFTPPYPSKKN